MEYLDQARRLAERHFVMTCGCERNCPHCFVRAVMPDPHLDIGSGRWVVPRTDRGGCCMMTRCTGHDHRVAYGTRIGPFYSQKDQNGHEWLMWGSGIWLGRLIGDPADGRCWLGFSRYGPGVGDWSYAAVHQPEHKAWAAWLEELGLLRVTRVDERKTAPAEENKE